MSEGLRAEDVKEALALFVARDGYEATVMAAARAWLASQAPDYEAAAKKLLPTMFWNDGDTGWRWWSWEESSEAMRDAARDTASDVVDAALVGFHPEDTKGRISPEAGGPGAMQYRHPSESPEVPT